VDTLALEAANLEFEPFYVPDLFMNGLRIQTVECYQCAMCGLTSADNGKQLPITDCRILVPIEEGERHDLQSMMKQVQAPKELEQYTCPVQCEGNRQLRRQVSERSSQQRTRSKFRRATEAPGTVMTKLVSTNPVLIIQVKRWVDIDQIMHKNHTPVDFQRSIDITVDGLHVPVTYHIQGIVLSSW
jgi:hypothetical protein